MKYSQVKKCHILHPGQTVTLCGRSPRLPAMPLEEYSAAWRGGKRICARCRHVAEAHLAFRSLPAHPEEPVAVPDRDNGTLYVFLPALTMAALRKGAALAAGAESVGAKNTSTYHVGPAWNPAFTLIHLPSLLAQVEARALAAWKGGAA